jgi:flagellar L-ring protein precursor FlgH
MPALSRSGRAAAFALGCMHTATAQNPYVRAGINIGIVADPRARNIGDILTVQIQEQTTVVNNDKIERTNSTSLAARLDSFTIDSAAFNAGNLPGLDVRKEQANRGEAKQNTASTVKASIAVVVIDVQPNGNLVVAGARSVKVQDETRTLRISGLVRQLDITPLNTVGSAQVADARIAITGEGASTRQVTKGPIGQMFDTLIWAAWPF